MTSVLIKSLHPLAISVGNHLLNRTRVTSAPINMLIFMDQEALSLQTLALYLAHRFKLPYQHKAPAVTSLASALLKHPQIAEAGERKRESEERRAAKERENEHKRTQSISKKQQRLIDEEKRKEFRALQKQNKNLKACSCNKKLADDKENKQLWLNCFKCYSWVCYDCLPAMFKTKTKSVYTCEDCSNSA